MIDSVYCDHLQPARARHRREGTAAVGAVRELALRVGEGRDLLVEDDVELARPVLPRGAPLPLDPLALVGDRRRDHEHAAVGVRLLVDDLEVVAAPAEPVGDRDAEVRLALLRVASLRRRLDDVVGVRDHAHALRVALLQQLDARARRDDRRERLLFLLFWRAVSSGSLSRKSFMSRSWSAPERRFRLILTSERRVWSPSTHWERVSAMFCNVCSSVESM